MINQTPNLNMNLKLMNLSLLKKMAKRMSLNIRKSMNLWCRTNQKGTQTESLSLKGESANKRTLWRQSQRKVIVARITQLSPQHIPLLFSPSTVRHRVKMMKTWSLKTTTRLKSRRKGSLSKANPLSKKMCR